MSDPVPVLPNSWRDALRDVEARLQQPVAALPQLLQEVVGHAVAAVGAAEGSILVPDDAQSLQFLVSHSPTAAKLTGLRVPIAGSIAGYVFGTGQMMAVGDLTEELPPQFYAEIDRQVGVATRTYLVVPILSGSRPRGVATYVNRLGKPPFRPFSQQEMEQARAFAAIEAVLLRHLDRSRQLGQLAANDLAATVASFGGASMAMATEMPGGEMPSEPWVRALQELESLPQDDQALCADFIGLLAQRRSQDRP
jgi:GAF domain-containing protein